MRISVIILRDGRAQRCGGLSKGEHSFPEIEQGIAEGVL
jgi:hypothetical protein